MGIPFSAEPGKKGNKLRKTHQIQIVEHVYDGSPRWREDRTTSCDPHIKDGKSPLAREPSVRSAIRSAFGASDPESGQHPFNTKFGQDVFNVVTCTNPQCDQRTQYGYKAASHTSTGKHDPDTWKKCSKCNKDMSILHYGLIENKWIYVLTGQGDQIKLAYEIFAEAKNHWLVLPKPKPARRYFPVFQGKKRHKRIFRSGNRLPVEKGMTYRFFLSPVQLGKASLKRLLEGGKDANSSSGRVNDHSGMNEQLDISVIVREFNSTPHLLVGSKTKDEVVAVIDPFAFALETKEWDSRPAAQALYALKFDKDEQAKQNIASILTALVGEHGEDKFDLVDEIKKASTKYTRSKNSAQAWLDAHKDCSLFLTKNVELATLRVVEWLNSDAHRIVEQSIQERCDDPDILALGMLHYTSLVKDLMVNSVGQAFITRVVRMRKKGLIYRFIIAPGSDEKKAINKLRENYGDLAVQLLGLFLPVLVDQYKSSDPAEGFLNHLNNLGVEGVVTGEINLAPGFGYKGFQVTRNTIKDIANTKKLEKLVGYIPTRISGRVGSMYTVFVDLETHIQSIFNLYAGLALYMEKPKSDDTALDQILQEKDKWEFPFKAAKYASDVSKIALARKLKRNYSTAAVLLSSKKSTYIEASTALRKMIKDEDALKILSRDAKVYRSISSGTKIITGPVALVFGGMEMLTHSKGMIDSWADGDPGKAVGNAMLFSAATLAASAALVESLSMVGLIASSSATSFAGPVGIIVALVTIGATIVIWKYAKSDLELYASHCFLGNEYGKGSTGPKYAGGMQFKNWDWGLGKHVAQSHYLYNLISSVCVVLSQNKNMFSDEVLHYGALIRTGLLPPDAMFEVEVTGKYIDFAKGVNGERVEITATAYIARDTGEYYVVGDKNYPAPKARVEAVPADSWGKKEFRYCRISLNYEAIQKLEAPVVKGRQGFSDTREYHFNVKFRIRCGNSLNMPYGDNNWLELKTKDIGPTGLGHAKVTWP